jgi:hypothetical protein
MIRAPSADIQEFRFVEVFGSAAADLDRQFRRLLACDPFSYLGRPKRLPASVVYLLSEGEEPCYVGRSNKFGQRLGNHCRPSSQHNQSSFAFRLACRSVGFEMPRYKAGNSAAAALSTVEGLSDAFVAAKARLRAMDIRYVEEADQPRQAMLEIYCALALGTPHDFTTH